MDAIFWVWVGWYQGIITLHLSIDIDKPVRKVITISNAKAYLSLTRDYSD